MKPLRIFIKNFCNHKLTEIDCTQFSKVLIIGSHKSNPNISNGVGKTTIYRAIEYVLFNKTHSTTLDKIVRDGANKAIVEFDFLLNNEIYRVYRHRTKSGATDVRLYKQNNGEFVSITERTPSATDLKINELIKISHKAFTYSILFRQADLTGISSVSDPKQRKEILKEPLNLSVYSKLSDLASKKLTPIRKELNQIEGSVSVIGNPDEDIIKTKEDIVNNTEKINNVKISISKKEESLVIHNNTIEELKKSLNKEDLDIHSKIKQQEKELSKILENSESNNKKKNFIVNKISSVINDIEKIDKLIIDNKNKFDLLNIDSEIDLNNLTEQYNKICDDEITGSEYIATVKANIDMTKLTLPESNTCQTCFQPISEEYRNKIHNDVESKLSKLNEKLSKLQFAMSKCKNKKSKLETSLQQERKRISDLEKIENSLNINYNNKKSKEELLNNLYNEQSDIINTINDINNQIPDIKKQLDILREAANKSDALIINNKIFELEKDISNIKKDISNDYKLIDSLNSLIGGLNERISSRTEDKEKLSKLLEKQVNLNYELKIRQSVVNAFNPDGIPNFIIQNVLDELQFEVNSSIKDIRPELEIQIDSDLNIEYRRNGIAKDYSQLSHGQHVYIALAFKKAISNIICKKLGINLNLLEFDEVDAHLDEAGLEAFYSVIQKWEKDFTIFVITHNKDLKDKFSHIILVEEDKDGAEGRLVIN